MERPYDIARSGFAEIYRVKVRGRELMGLTYAQYRGQAESAPVRPAPATSGSRPSPRRVNFPSRAENRQLAVPCRTAHPAA